MVTSGCVVVRAVICEIQLPASMQPKASPNSNAEPGNAGLSLLRCLPYSAVSGNVCLVGGVTPSRALVRGEPLGVRSTVAGFHVVGVQTVEDSLTARLDLST